MFCKGESADAFAKMFRCTKEAVKLLHGFELELYTGCSDKSNGIRKAYAQEFPTATWITCYPHIALKPHKEWKASMVNKQYVDSVIYHIKLLHKTRSVPMFDLLAPIVVRTWRAVNEHSLANLVEPEYFKAPYNVWSINVAKRLGVTPSSQPIESYNADTKESKVFWLRARMDEMMNKTLPEVLLFDSIDLTSPIHRIVTGPPGAHLVEKASKFQATDFLEYPAGSQTYYFNTKEHLGVKVTVARIKPYVEGTTGKALVDGRATIESFLYKHMSLYKCFYDPTFQLEEGMNPGLWVCECKGCVHNVVCSHTTKCRDLHEEGVDVAESMNIISVRQAPGRKRKTVVGGWVRQPVQCQPVKSTRKSEPKRSHLA